MPTFIRNGKPYRPSAAHHQGTDHDLGRGTAETVERKRPDLAKLQQEMLQLRPRIDELQAFLNNSKDTLQGWLKENKKGWEENIGKLCDESILWQRGFSANYH